MKKNPLVINFAVIIIRKIELYEHIIRYLHKFNMNSLYENGTYLHKKFLRFSLPAIYSSYERAQRIA